MTTILVRKLALALAASACLGFVAFEVLAASPSSAAKVTSPTCSTVSAAYVDAVLGPSPGAVKPTA